MVRSLEKSADARGDPFHERRSSVGHLAQVAQQRAALDLFARDEPKLRQLTFKVGDGWSVQRVDRVRVIRKPSRHREDEIAVNGNEIGKRPCQMSALLEVLEHVATHDALGAKSLKLREELGIFEVTSDVDAGRVDELMVQDPNPTLF
jgi:hypothetical protein